MHACAFLSLSLLPPPLLSISLPPSPSLAYSCGQTAAEWESVFILAGMIHFCGVIFYAFFASGELQPWAEPGGSVVLPGQTVVGPGGVGMADAGAVQGWAAAGGAAPVPAAPVNPFAQPNGSTAAYVPQQQQQQLPPTNPYAADTSQYQQSWTTTADPIQAAQATWN